MIYLEKVMNRLNDWMNDEIENKTYKLIIENNEIHIFDHGNGEHVATVHSNLSYSMIRIINDIKTENDFIDWIFYQETNFKIVRILSTV
jgi:fido (protein-threonine AMPylation protein)